MYSLYMYWLNSILFWVFGPYRLWKLKYIELLILYILWCMWHSFFCPEVHNSPFICLLWMFFFPTDSSAFLYICLLLSLYPVSYCCLCYFAVSGCSRFPDPGGPWSRSPGSLSYPGALLYSVIQESKYSETCLIRHLCNSFHCVIRHPVHYDKISLPSSACWITQLLL